MSKRKPTLPVITTIALCGLLLATPRQVPAQAVAKRTASTDNKSLNPSKGLAAIDAAAQNGKYLFVFFWKTRDEQSRTMDGVFQAAMAKWAKSADSIGIQITDPREKPVVDKFGVSRAPMPLVVAMAPNGAVTKGFPIKCTERQLQEAFVSPCTAECMKALQDRKLVLLCVQNQQTQAGQAALQGVQRFKADTRFASATKIVTLDPADRAEASFLKALQVDPRTPTAVTVLLAPPGQPIAKFAGPVAKDEIIAKVTAAQSGPCAGGKCGPGGCGPKK